MNEQFLRDLHRLYADSSKHSIYQSTPDFVSAKLGYSEKIDEKWRGDRPRLAWLLEYRVPQVGEHWCDFGANTGFFTLSLAHRHPRTRFTAVEANAAHADFIRRVIEYFELENVEVLERTIGIESLESLPQADLLLHLNVLHHAGYDFDGPLVHNTSQFADYATRYLGLLRIRARELFFQMGSNWGGDKKHPIVAVRDDAGKLDLFRKLLVNSGWGISHVAYASHDREGQVVYRDLRDAIGEGLGKRSKAIHEAEREELAGFDLDRFPGEFYRRPLFLCQTATMRERHSGHG